VVGGGKAAGFPRLKRSDVSLNLDACASPDVLGDILRLPFAAKCFDEVYLERVPFTAFTGRQLTALRELHRVLLPGGRLIIETGALAPARELRNVLRAVGFANVRFRVRGLLRITARRERERS
jgi:ubiquinone/menaquinone biosynthesis C-methylase UbiE